uniref:Uncharacterized protein n=1 Tax=Parascaris univalens TaxID=6257 RepID=A0A915BLQ6_PARUN
FHAMRVLPFGLGGIGAAVFSTSTCLMSNRSSVSSMLCYFLLFLLYMLQFSLYPLDTFLFLNTDEYNRFNTCIARGRTFFIIQRRLLFIRRFVEATLLHI